MSKDSFLRVSRCESHCFYKLVWRVLQGAERKTRDEERRAAKRKMTATGRKKLDELYHPAAERTEFYSMADLHKPPVLFTPSEEVLTASRVRVLNNLDHFSFSFFY